MAAVNQTPPIDPRDGDATGAALRPAGRHGAFVLDGFDALPPGAAAEAADLAAALGAPPTLADQRLAVKDVFEVQGLRLGAGSPRWLEASPPAARTASAVLRLLAAGAAWAGKTVTDELTYSLAGVNVHYGTPCNPAAAERIPGGSSSGSAAAVAGGHADIGLGTDCGGSVRLPASYCGLWGLRPTHGRLPGGGMFALAPSFDTVGWFTRDGALLARVFEVLAHGVVPDAPPPLSLVVADDALALLEPAVAAAFESALQTLDPAAAATRVPAGRLPLAAWAAAFRTLQAAEIWQQHAAWFVRHGDSLGPDIRARFDWARSVTPAAVAAAQARRVAAAALMAALLDGPGRLLLLPTTPTPAPWRHDPPARLDDIRQRSFGLLCAAGLAGLPQISLPWTTVDGAPVGLSLVGPRGSDETLLAAARQLHARLQPPVPTAELP